MRHRRRTGRPRFIRSRCDRRGHDWFPPPAQREFIPVTSVCLHCTEQLVLLPFGACLYVSGHPIADHYTDAGDLVALTWCPAGPA